MAEKKPETAWDDERRAEAKRAAEFGSDISKAREAQKRRMAAPVSQSTGPSQVLQKEIEAEYPECKSKVTWDNRCKPARSKVAPPKMHPFWAPCERQDRQRFGELGYEPVVKRGEQRKVGKMGLYFIPQELWERDMQRHTRAASMRARSKSEEEKGAPPGMVETEIEIQSTG